MVIRGTPQPFSTIALLILSHWAYQHQKLSMFDRNEFHDLLHSSYAEFVSKSEEEAMSENGASRLECIFFVLHRFTRLEGKESQGVFEYLYYSTYALLIPCLLWIPILSVISNVCLSCSSSLFMLWD